LWWTWQPEAAARLCRLDYDLWESLGHNPIQLLREIGRARLNQARMKKNILRYTTASLPASMRT